MKLLDIKYLKFLIALMVIIVLVIAVRNKLLMDQYFKNFLAERARVNNITQTNLKIEDAVIASLTVAMNHLGKQLHLEGVKRIFPDKQVYPLHAKHPRLLLVFSEMACNVCQDEETQFAVNIASEYGNDYVIAIVHASNQRYVRNFIRMNQVTFPVYFSQNRAFMDKNGIINTPLILVIDENQRVISAHFPIPGQSKYSEPIHKFCYNYFNMQ